MDDFPVLLQVHRFAQVEKAKRVQQDFKDMDAPRGRTMVGALGLLVGWVDSV